MDTTDVRPLPAHPGLAQFKEEVNDLVRAWKSGDPQTIQRVKRYHPRHQSPEDAVEAAVLRSGQPPDREVLAANFTFADARLVIAREHGFLAWPEFADHLESIGRKDSRALRFESAADSIVSGDVAALERLLHEDPELIRGRSTRAHRATLLHYISANGLERYRQRTPKNAVQVATVLLEAGAEVDAVADVYGGGATLGLVAASKHAARAGLQVPLLEKLLDRGADIAGPPGTCQPLRAALANGFREAAEFLAGRGARLDMASAAGLGRLDLLGGYLDEIGRSNAPETKEELDTGFVWACRYGRIDVVEFLLQRGGADVSAITPFPTGNPRIDEALRRHGATA